MEKIDILFRVNFKSKAEWENFKRLASLGQRYLLEKSEERFRTKTTKEIFTEIYQQQLWGTSDEGFNSGPGTHDRELSEVYINAVNMWLEKVSEKLIAVDLGCGDFHIGSQLVSKIKAYIGCDIVNELIVRNRKKFKFANLEFQQLDLTKDELPDGDVVFLRQVLQHLSNDLIIKSIRKIELKYKYLILTEHIPHQKEYIKNIDKPSGWLTRINLGSAVDITKAPFDFKYKNRTELCAVSHGGGLVQTLLYETG